MTTALLAVVVLTEVEEMVIEGMAEAEVQAEAKVRAEVRAEVQAEVQAEAEAEAEALVKILRTQALERVRRWICLTGTANWQMS